MIFTLDTGWTMMMARDAQHAADAAVILRKVNELALNPGMNIQDGMLTTSERTYREPEAELLREFLGAPDDTIDCPTEAQRELFGPKRRRVPMMDLKNPVLLGPVQNQEHHMNGVVAQRNNFNEPILGFIEQCSEEFAQLTSRRYGLIHEYKTEDADTVFVSLGCAAGNIEAACDYLREQRNAKVGSSPERHPPLPRGGGHQCATRQEKRHHHRAHRRSTRRGQPWHATSAPRWAKARRLPSSVVTCRRLRRETAHFRGSYGIGSRDFRPEHTLGAYEFATGRPSAPTDEAPPTADYFTLGIDHPYAVISKDTPPCCRTARSRFDSTRSAAGA